MDYVNHPFLNAPLFATQLFIPRYEQVTKENWRITFMGLGFDHGYFSDVWVVENMPILARRSKDNPEKWESWMSICPHELESQELCCRYASGNVVIMGLGMGWVAINTAMNSMVEKVIVVELDEEVIEVFNESGAMRDVPEEIKTKIVIVKDDALKWKSNLGKINFLYADIWRTLLEESTLDDIRIMQSNVQANKIYFWGQELFLFREFKNSGLDEVSAGSAFFNECIKKMDLPLLIPEDLNYFSMIIKAGEQRIKRKMNI